MLRGVEHLLTHRAAGLPLKPGGRKTSITLAAFSELKRRGEVQTMLVIAPLRVCRQVWRQEGAKWTDFRHLKFSFLHGAKKRERLEDDADIWLINPEGVPWLCKQYFGRNLPFDVVAVDELTRFKNHQSERSKALRPRIAKTQWRWGLTGSLAPNGYLDLFGQQLMLDGGAALGKYITHYRDQYFQLGYDGFSYELLPGAEKRITERLAPYWMYVDEKDYSELPGQVDNIISLEFDKASHATYTKMKNTLIASLPEGLVTAANQAACYSKLSQMANGAVYAGDNKDAVAPIHDMKLDAIGELLEELNGEPLLVGYEFNHDIDRLRERFGKIDPVTNRKVIPYLGKGTTARQEDLWIGAWNRGELPLLCAHPASAGHGLNMQGANACHVAWFGITWDYELYDQFIRRVRRSGNTSKQVFNHLLIVSGTIDELKLAALRDKDTTQTRLLQALNTEILRERGDSHPGGETPADDRRLPTMVARLARQGDTGAGQAAPAPRGWGQQAQPKDAPQETAEQDTRTVPRGWGQIKEQAAEQPSQREAIRERIAPPPSNGDARAAFSPETRQRMQAVEQGEDTAPEPPAAAKRTRRSAASQPTNTDSLIAARAAVLAVAFNDPATSVNDGLEIARSLMEFVEQG